MRTFLLTLLIVLSFLAIACRPQGPGEGPAYEEGTKVARPIVAALEKFKADNGKYPAHLDELVPHYISENPQRKKPAGSVNYSYYPGGDRKSFSFTYSFANILWTDECSYDSEQKQWVCGGRM